MLWRTPHLLVSLMEKALAPLVEEQTQVQFTRIEDQTGMAVEMLVMVASHQLMHCIMVASNGF